MLNIEIQCYSWTRVIQRVERRLWSIKWRLRNTTQWSQLIRSRGSVFVQARYAFIVWPNNFVGPSAWVVVGQCLLCQSSHVLCIPSASAWVHNCHWIQIDSRRSLSSTGDVWRWACSVVPVQWTYLEARTVVTNTGTGTDHGDTLLYRAWTWLGKGTHSGGGTLPACILRCAGQTGLLLLCTSVKLLDCWKVNCQVDV